jgi:hypothetical protein
MVWTFKDAAGKVATSAIPRQAYTSPLEYLARQATRFYFSSDAVQKQRPAACFPFSLTTDLCHCSRPPSGACSGRTLAVRPSSWSHLFDIDVNFWTTGRRVSRRALRSLSSPQGWSSVDGGARRTDSCSLLLGRRPMMLGTNPVGYIYMYIHPPCASRPVPL